MHRTAQWLAISGATACAAATCMAGWSLRESLRSEPARAARLAPELIQVGVVPRSTRRVVSLELQNNLPGTIENLQVISSCGCTVPEVGVQSLATSERTAIDLTFTAGKEELNREILLVVSYDFRGIAFQEVVVARAMDN